MTGGRRVVIVVADDLIWATRLRSLVARAGAEVALVATESALLSALDTAPAAPVLVDLTARGYDPLAAIARAARNGSQVLSVGQHDDHEMRKRALGAGARRVLAYRKLAEDGPGAIARWLDGDAGTPPRIDEEEER